MQNPMCTAIRTAIGAVGDESTDAASAPSAGGEPTTVPPALGATPVPDSPLAPDTDAAAGRPGR